MELKINQEFKNLIPPLTPDEYKMLANSIITEGCRDAIVVWNNIIIDGHNRYEICTTNNIEFRTVSRTFDNEERAKDWIDSNQLSRRNLTEDQRKILIGRRYNREKNNHGGTGRNQYNKVQSDQIDHSAKTADKIANEYNISAPTVRRYSTDATYFEKIQEEEPELASQIWSGEKKLTQIKNEDKKLKREQIIKTNAPLYKNTELITLIEGDIFDVINEVQDKSIDCLCVDPPYHVMEDYDWDKQEIDFLDRWITTIKSKLKNEYTGFIFCDARMIYEFETVIKTHFDIKNRLIWLRKNMANGRVIKSKFISSYEVIFYFGNKDLNLPEDWGSERFDSFEYAVPQSNFSEGKFHPTQKPIELIKRLINVGSHEGESVLDCFAGSGTTGIACKELNRKCILIERESEYINTIKGRLL